MNVSTIYNSTLPSNIYHQYKIDMVVEHYLQQELVKKSKEDKKSYESPKRNIVCSHCGQQYYWCNCDLNIK